MILLVILLAIGAGMVVQVMLAVQIAEAEATARSLRMEYEWIQFENSELIYQIATRSSLGQVQRRAEEVGYIPATSRTYVYRDRASTTGLLPAHGTLLPAAPASAPAPAGAAGAQAQPWWQPAHEWFTQGLAHFAPDWAGQGGTDDGFSSP